MDQIAADLEINKLKKENTNLNAVLSKYRKLMKGFDNNNTAIPARTLKGA